MSPRTHIDELLADRAIWGLGREEQSDLASTLAQLGGSEPDDSWDRAAASITGAFVDWQDRAPEHLIRKLESDAIQHYALQRGIRLSHLAAAMRPPAAGRVPPETPPASRTWLPALVAAAAVVFAVVVGWDRWTATPGTPAEQRSAMLQTAGLLRLDWDKGPSELAGEPAGDVIWSDSAQRGFMVFRGLPANDPGERQYQLWIFDRSRSPDRPVDGGVFDVPAGGGELVVPIDAKIAVGEAFAFAVTVEKPGGVVVSDREHIVTTAGL